MISFQPKISNAQRHFDISATRTRKKKTSTTRRLEAQSSRLGQRTGQVERVATMPKKSKKSKSKRVPLRRKHRIIKKVAEHAKKKKKELRKDKLAGKVQPRTKDPGIPSSYPFKAELMRELEFNRERDRLKKERRKAEQERQQQVIQRQNMMMQRPSQEHLYQNVRDTHKAHFGPY